MLSGKHGGIFCDRKGAGNTKKGSGQSEAEERLQKQETGKIAYRNSVHINLSKLTSKVKGETLWRE